MLLTSIVLGGYTGYYVGEVTPYLKPWGEIFLNLIFTTIVPLIFFSIASTIARLGSVGKLSRIIFYTTLIFLFTGLIAAIYALLIVTIFPPCFYGICFIWPEKCKALNYSGLIFFCL
ncbi:MAG: cation:dicarboxylase symporter family transporter [Legionella sp.]